MKTLQKIRSQENGAAVCYEELSSCVNGSDSHGEVPEFPIPYGVHMKHSLSPSFKRVLAFIHSNYMNRLTLGVVAQHVYLNKTYVSQLFSKHLDVSFVTYLEILRISHAENLLVNTDLSVAEIAAQIGYAGASYFTKVFKKRSGMTPLEYRYLCDSNADF